MSLGSLQRIPLSVGGCSGAVAPCPIAVFGVLSRRRTPLVFKEFSVASVQLLARQKFQRCDAQCE